MRVLETLPDFIIRGPASARVAACPRLGEGGEAPPASARRGLPYRRYTDVMHYILFYDLAADYLERRGPLRPGHLSLVKEAHDKGDLVMAGALAEPADGAVLVFRSREAAEAFAAADPYVLQGLIRDWRVRTWMTVLGDGARMPDV